MNKIIQKIIQAERWAHHHTLMVLSGLFLFSFMASWQLIMPQLQTQAAWYPSWCQDNSATLAISVQECETLASLYTQLELSTIAGYSSWFEGDGSDIASTWNGITVESGSVTYLSLMGSNNATGQSLSFAGLDNLSNLSLWSFEINAIDISQNTNLNYLNVRYTNITDINLDNNVLLETMDLEGNDLASIDVSNLVNLKQLALSYNPLVGGIDVTNNPSLENISYFGGSWYGYPLTGVDLSNNPNLKFVSFYGSSIREIDLSNKPLLRYVNIAGGSVTGTMDLSASTQLTYLDVGGSDLTSIIFPTTTGMTYIDLQNNELTSIDLSPIVGSSGSLHYLYLQGNFINDLGTDFDVFDNIGLMSGPLQFADAMNGNCLNPETLSPSYISFLNTEFANWEANQTCGRDVSEAEYDALMALYNATDGPNWTNNDGWGEDNSVCDWYGVTCDGGNTYVQGIHLQTNGLNGYIPPLEGLSNLVDFYADNWDDENLADNILDVDLAAFANMPNLRSLSIFKPQSVTGSLDDLVVTGNTGHPMNPSVGVINQLRLLQLSSQSATTFTYTPAQLAQFPYLDSIYLNNNIIVGDLAPFGTMPQLVNLDVGCYDTIEICQATGTLDFIDNTPLLEVLKLNALNLYGTLPESINTLQYLEELSLDENYFTGPLPTLDASTNLTQLELSNVPFQGELPEEWGNLTNLTDLQVGGRGIQNRGIVGSLPESWSNLTNLDRLTISFTRLTGSLPESWSGLTNLTELQVFFNNIQGEIPDSWSVFTATQFDRFWLQNNHLEGDFPSWMENMNQTFKVENNCLNIDSVIPESTLESTLNEYAAGWSNQNNCLSNMVVQKTLSDTQILPGDTFTMTISYQNNGSQKAPRFEINEVLDEDIQLLSAIPPHGEAIVNKSFGVQGDVCFDDLMYGEDGPYYEYMADVLGGYLAGEGELPPEMTAQDIINAAFDGFLGDANLSIPDLAGPTYFNDPNLTTGGAITTILCGAGQGIQLVGSQIRALYANVGESCLPLFGIDYRSYRDQCGAGGEDGYRWDLGDVLPGGSGQIVLTLRLSPNAPTGTHDTITYLVIDGENESSNTILLNISTAEDEEEEETEDNDRPSGGDMPKKKKDVCLPIPPGDQSNSYYDTKCQPLITHQAPETKDYKPDPIKVQELLKQFGDKYSQELIEAYLFAKNVGMTSIADITSAMIYDPMPREQFAKIASQYAINVLDKQPDMSKIEVCAQFGDIANRGDLTQWMQVACMLNIMGYKSDGETIDTNFRPDDIVTRAQYLTILSRMMFGDMYNSTKVDDDQRYAKHMQAMQEKGYVKDISNPTAEELRGYAFLILYRTY